MSDRKLGREPLATGGVSHLSVSDVTATVWGESSSLPIPGSLTASTEPVCPNCARPLNGFRGPLCRYCDPKADCE